MVLTLFRIRAPKKFSVVDGSIGIAINISGITEQCCVTFVKCWYRIHIWTTIADFENGLSIHVFPYNIEATMFLLTTFSTLFC